MAVAPSLDPWVLLLGGIAVLLLCTAFTKAWVVLGALRVGLGARAVLPWPIMLALALVVTGVVMAPVAEQGRIASEALGGGSALAAGDPVAWSKALEPLQAFVERHASVAEREFFAELAAVSADDPRAVVPAFLVTELHEALQMAVLILLPLVLVDLVVAQVLSLLSLPNMPTKLLTLPLKLLLFVAVGGWDVVIGGIVKGYG